MSLQSTRIRAATSEKKVQHDIMQQRVSLKIKETKNKMKIGDAVNVFSDEKPTIGILSEVQHENSKRKRKAVSENSVLDKNYLFTGKQIKVESDNQEEENLENVSEYEKTCRKNIEEKMAFFASLNFDEAKQDFLTASSDLNPKPKPKKLCIKKEQPLPSRCKSRRLQRISPENQPLPPRLGMLKLVAQKPHEPLTFEEVFKSENQSSEELVKDLFMISREEIKHVHTPLSYCRYESYFTSMRLNSSSVAKVASSKIFSLAIHPSTYRTLVCAGSNYGRVSFWDIESKNPQGGVYVYEPHTRSVSSVAFNVDFPHQVISSSYDGTVRLGHLEAGVFEEVYHTNEDDEIRCSYFDFLSPSSLLVALSTGQVAAVDMRTPMHKKEIRHITHSCPIKTVSVHPLQKDYFIAAGTDGIVSLWDLRSIKKKESIADMVLSRSVNSAFFSPVTGNVVLTTSMDNKLCLFDSTRLDKTISLKTTIRHDNYSGFRAVWLPDNEDAFIVGSMMYPHRIEVYCASGELAHNFSGEDLASVCSINAFHPSKPILAGANSSGKLHVFKGK